MTDLPPAMPSMRRRISVYLLIYAILASASLVFCRPVLSAWFTADEVFIIDNTDPKTHLQIFTHWDGGNTNFVPFLLSSLKLDWQLFGWNTTAFRVHTILAGALAATLIVWLMRRWCSFPMACLCGAIFLFSSPTVGLIGWVASRHYLEGLVPCLVAVIAMFEYVKQPRWWLLAVALLCYFIACLFKEVYVPLPMVLVFMPGMKIRQRLRILACFFVVSAAYAVYRGFMLGTAVGGYTADTYRPGYIARYFFGAWPEFTGWMLYGPSRSKTLPTLIFINGLILLALYQAYRKSWQHALTMIACFVAVTLPVAIIMGTPQANFLKVASHYCTRFMFLPLTVVLLWGTYAVHRTLGRFAVIPWAVLLLIAASGASRQHPAWTLDGEITHRSARVFERWWNKKAVFATDVPLALHLSLLGIWSRHSPSPPANLARPIPAASGAISARNPYLRDADVTFVEDLRDAPAEVLLSRKEFLAKYGRP